MKKLEAYGFKKKEQKENITTIIDKDECKVIYIENFLDNDKINKVVDLIKRTEFKEEIIKMFGKEITAPRMTCSFGDEGLTYSYARKKETCKKWTEEMKELRDLVFNKSKEYGDNEDPFNFVLLNYYKNNSDYIGPHSDNEKDIIEESTIASLSIGSERKFIFIRDKEKITLKLKNGSLLLMTGKTQQFYKHTLPKEKNKCGKRYNFTFRHLKKFK